MTEPTRRRTRQQTASAAEDSCDGAISSPPAPPRAAIKATNPSPLPPSPPPSPPASSFFTVPTVVLTGVGLPPLGGISGQRIYEQISRHVTDNSASRLLRLLLVGENGLLLDVWAVLQASVFRQKTARSAVPYFLAAIIFNHARRTLFFGEPAAGFFVLPQPDDDWRLLLARPDVFLEDVVKAVRGWKYVQAVLLKGLWDILAGGLTATLILADDVTLRGIISRDVELFPVKRKEAVTRTLVRRSQDIATTFFIVWLFSCIEFAVAQASATLAIGYAIWMMLKVPGKGGPDLLMHILFGGGMVTTSWVLLFAWLQLVVLPWTGLVPLVGRSLTNPIRRPGVLLSLAFTYLAMYTVLRYRSRLYIAIETSGLFVFLVYVLVSGLLVVAGVAGKWSKGENVRK